MTRSATGVTIVSSTGTNAAIPAAEEGVGAGVMTEEQVTVLNQQQENPLATPAAYIGPWSPVGAYLFAHYDADIFTGETLTEGYVMLGPLADGVRKMQIHWYPFDTAEVDDPLAALAAIGSLLNMTLLSDSSAVFSGNLVPGSYVNHSDTLIEVQVRQVAFAQPSDGASIHLEIQSEIDKRFEDLEATPGSGEPDRLSRYPRNPAGEPSRPDGALQDARRLHHRRLQRQWLHGSDPARRANHGPRQPARAVRVAS